MHFQPCNLRMPAELVERLDRQVARIREHSLLVTREDVVTLLLGAALDDTEGNPRPGVRRPALRRISSPVNQLVRALELQREDAEVQSRVRERAHRESMAPSLRERVPSLSALDLQISYYEQGFELADAGHVRHVVVERARAHFWIACLDRSCAGGHDVTETLVEALERGETSIVGQQACDGGVRTPACSRVMHFVAAATHL